MEEHWGKTYIGYIDDNPNGAFGDVWEATENIDIVVCYDSDFVVEDVFLKSELTDLSLVNASRIEALKQTVVGKFTCWEIAALWGEADASLSEMWGEIYNLGDDATVCIYYDDSATVEKVLLSLSGKHVYTLDDITENSFESIKKTIINHKWTLEELEKIWGEPSHKEQSDKSYTWELSSGVSLVVTEFEYVDMIIPYIKNPLDSIPWLSIISKSNLKAVSEHLVGNYTIMDICDAWGEPYSESDDFGNAIFEVEENMFVQISFDSDGVVEGVELISRTPLAQNTEAIDKLSSPLYCLTDIEWLNEQLVGKVGYEWLWEKWGTPELAATGEDVSGDGWIIMDSIDLMVYYDTDDAESAVEKIVIERSPSEWEYPGIIGSQLIGKYTYQEVIDMWGMPNQKTEGRWGMVYEIGDEYFLMLYFGEDDVITEAVFSPRTSLE